MTEGRNCPSIILANVRSLRSKVNERQAHFALQWPYKGASLTDSELATGGFDMPVGMDRDKDPSGKSEGGELCVYVSERWCNPVTVWGSIFTLNYCHCHSGPRICPENSASCFWLFTCPHLRTLRVQPKPL